MSVSAPQLETEELETMSHHSMAQNDESNASAAVACMLCAVSGGFVGFLVGLAAAWL